MFKSILLFFLVSFVSNANAFVSYNEEKASEPTKVNSLYDKFTDNSGVLKNPVFVNPQTHCDKNPGLININDPPKNLPRISRSGQDSLVPALKRLLPNGWHARKDSAVDANIYIGWSKGSFVDGLYDIAIENNLVFHVDWNSKTVTVFQACEKYPIKEPLIQTTLNEQPTEISKPNSLAQPVVKPFYRLRQNHTLSEELTEWCKVATNSNTAQSWSLVWEAAKDQVIEADSSYGTDMLEALGKLQSTIIENNLPLRIYFFENNVIKVTN